MEQLEWTGRHRVMMEKLIRYGNAYAQNYSRETDLGEGVRLTPAQLQVLEYLVENENHYLKMARIAAVLGISPSTLTKQAARLTEKGYLEKYHVTNNFRDVIIRPTEKGKAAYRQYLETMEPIFQQLAGLWETIPPEAAETFLKTLALLSQYNSAMTREDKFPPDLIPVKK